ncbi:MAG: SDR family oxidoreductase [Lachnospiraceae bacterium]|jgi:3-oxoacyl-[acyl-carrier protein] reductase|nr:SDR family oxidoreductase [Lachnospiraceae bacterium]
MFDLADKVVLVTGAAGGIGKATALLLAKHGAKALVMTDVRKEPLEKSADEIKAETGVETLCIDGNLISEEFDKKLVEETVKVFGSLDVLVNCAGISRAGDIYSVNEQQWDLTFNINVKGLFFLCRAAFVAMEKQGGGSIINLSSQAGRAGGILVTPDYPSSKAAVLTLTKSLAKAGAAKGIRVNSVSPGLIATEMTATYNYDPTTVPLGRIGTGEDVAGAILFLASEYASYITGACIDVNGGIAMI